MNGNKRMRRRRFFGKQISALIVWSLVCGAGTTPVQAADGRKRTAGKKKSASLWVKKTRAFDPSDSARKNWYTPQGKQLSLGVIDAAHGESLIVPVAFPAISQAWRGTENKTMRLVSYRRHSNRPALIIRALQYEVHVPESIPAGMRLQVRLLLKSKDGFWFEALGRRLRSDGSGHKSWVPATALHPGWNTIQVDLSDESVELAPRGHQLRWSRYFLSRVRAMGLSFQGDRPFVGELAVDNLTAWSASDRSREIATDNFSGPRRTRFSQSLQVVNFDPGATVIPRYGKAEFTFAVNRPLLNPFCQDEIRIDAEFTPPGGGAPIVVPAFYYQDFRRLKGSDEQGHEHRDLYLPVGPGAFKARFTPRQAGKYRYRIKVKYRSPVSRREEVAATETRTLVVTDREAKGFVRISPTDRRYFEFENGEFFFPIGHSFRSPNDPRHARRILRPYYPGRPAPKDRGLRAYEDLLPRMQAAGVNCFEVWMCAWWLGLEWTGKWKGYHGVGAYNMENAWKLDRLLQLAERHDQYVHLVIDNHGKAGHKNQHDGEWDDREGGSPYNIRNRADGGFLNYALELFRDPRAKAFYRDKLRYLAARWGWSTRILGIEMWSELDLIGHQKGRHRRVYAAPAIHTWHREMIAYLRQLDHGRHLITTHYSGDWTVIDRQMVAQPFIDYIVCDAYHNKKMTLMKMLSATDQFAYRYNKPWLVTEYGGFAYAAPREGLVGDLYGGVWFSWMSHAAGTPLYWWFEFLDMENLFPMYAAFARFIKGEDKRRGPGQPRLQRGWRIWPGGTKPAETGGLPVSVTRAGAPEQRLSALLLGDGDVYYVYVYDHASLNYLPLRMSQRPAFAGVKVSLGRVGAEAYTVEVWDCWQGKRLATSAARREADGTLAISLPRFVTHIALKVRRAESSEP